MTLRSTPPRASDLRAWMVAHVEALEHAGAAGWHVLRARMILDGFAGFIWTDVGAAGVTLNAEAAAALERDLALDDIAEDLVRELFTNGQGNQGELYT